MPVASAHRAAGMIAIDNVLRAGSVADASDTRPDTVALRAITAKIRDDARVDARLLSVGDGVMLARRL
jgi:predicted O-methyltransferase YrrM